MRLGERGGDVHRRVVVAVFKQADYGVGDVGRGGRSRFAVVVAEQSYAGTVVIAVRISAAGDPTVFLFLGKAAAKGLVAGVMEHARQRPDVVVIEADFRIVQIFAGQHRGAGGDADRSGRKVIFKTDALRCHDVDIGRHRVGRAIAAELPPRVMEQDADDELRFAHMEKTPL